MSELSYVCIRAWTQVNSQHWNSTVLFLTQVGVAAILKMLARNDELFQSHFKCAARSEKKSSAAVVSCLVRY